MASGADGENKTGEREDVALAGAVLAGPVSAVPVRPRGAGQAVEHQQHDAPDDRDEADEPPPAAPVGVVQPPNGQAEAHEGDDDVDDVLNRDGVSRAPDDGGDDVDDDGAEGKPPERRARGAPAEGDDVPETFGDCLAEADRTALQVAPPRLRLVVRAARPLRVRRVWSPHVILRISPESGSLERD